MSLGGLVNSPIFCNIIIYLCSLFECTYFFILLFQTWRQPFDVGRINLEQKKRKNCQYVKPSKLDLKDDLL